MPVATYQVYGLRVESAVALAAPTVPGGPPPDVRISEAGAGDVAAPADYPTELASHVALNGGVYVFRGGPTGYVLSFPGTCDFHVDADLSSVRVRRPPTTSDAVVAVLVEGNVLSFLLALRGCCVLHASASQPPGAPALAITGRSGAGKSSIAALMRSAGATFLSDDVVRVDLVEGRALAHPGTTSLRMRLGVEAEAVSLAGDVLAPTGDGRTSITTLPPAEAVPLGAVIVPTLDRAVAKTSLRRLRGAEALVALASAPRTAWVDPTQEARRLERVGELTRCVPVFAATVAWESSRREEGVRRMVELVLRELP